MPAAPRPPVEDGTDRGVAAAEPATGVDASGAHEPAATLEAIADVVRVLCGGADGASLERAVKMMTCRLPGVDGLVLEQPDSLLSAGSTTGARDTFELGGEPSVGRLVVHGPAAESGTTGHTAMTVIAPVVAGVLRQQQTERALAERESGSRRAVDTALDAIITMGDDGCIREFNPAAERMFGHRCEDVLGKALAEVLVPERLRAAHVTGMERYLSTRRGRVIGRRLEMPALHADGHELTVELAITPSTVNGHTAFTGFLRDITQAKDVQRRLENTTSRLRTLIASMHAGVLLEDEQRRIVVTNLAFTRMFGIPVPPGQLLGADCSRAAEESKHLFVDPDGFVASVEELLAARVLVTGEEWELRDGRVLERDYVPVFSGEEYLGHLWLYRDITRRKRAERRMLEQNQALADLADAKDRFVATVSHELRTPLTAVIGFTDILTRPETGPLTDQQRSFLGIVERNANQLLHLVNDLLTLMNTASQELRLDVAPVDLAGIVRATVGDHQARARERGVHLVVEAPDAVPVEADAARLRQLLDNIVGNAVKFTPRDGRVTVTVTADDDHWQVEVRDTGIGIPETEQDRLFTSFFRASNTRSGVVPGTGLGLAISRAIVELHGGEISVASKEGEGTTVVASLPRRITDDTTRVPA